VLALKMRILIAAITLLSFVITSPVLMAEGEGHNRFVPTHQKDLFQRYLDWLRKYLEISDQ